MEYWVAFKRGEYVSDIDKDGHLAHTKNKSDALRFRNFNSASYLNLFNLGYAILKEYN